MEKGTWTIAPCPPGELRRLEDELGITRDAGLGAGAARVRRSGLCAGVSRGRAAGARPIPARRHARGSRHDPGRRRRGKADLRPRRLRRRRHLRDRARGVPPARARRRSRLAPPVALRGGLRPQRADGREARRRRRRPRPHRRLRHHRRRGGREAKRLGLEVVVTDHHRPVDEFPDCPVVATLKGDYPFAGLCGTGVVWKLAEALLGAGASLPRPAPRHRRARHRRRRRAARRREPRARARRACGGSPRRRSPACRC